MIHAARVSKDNTRAIKDFAGNLLQLPATPDIKYNANGEYTFGFKAQ